MALTVTEPVDRMTERLHFRQWRHLHPKQWGGIKAAYTHPKARVLMGGSGFGGKSYGLRAALVHLALRLIKEGLSTERHRLKVLLACADYPSLKDRHFAALEEEYGEFGELVLNDKMYGLSFRFYDPSMPVICLRNLDGKKKGSEYAGGAIDELTEILQGQFGEFGYMVRRPGLPWNPIWAASNPDGIGHAWVKGVWRPLQADDPVVEVDGTPVAFRAPGRPSEVWDPEQALDPAALIYVPYLPDDNPLFDEASFTATLAGLAPHVQRARRRGTWDSPEGARWPGAHPDIQGFNPSELWRGGVPASWPRMLMVDWGTRAPFAALWAVTDADHNAYVFREIYRPGLATYDQIELIIETMGAHEILSSFDGDPAMWGKLPNSDLSPAEMYQERIKDDPRFACGFEAGSREHRVLKWATLDKMLDHGNGYPNLWIAHECKGLWNELTNAVYPKGTTKKDLSEDIDEACPDHALTALAYGFHKRYKAAKLLVRRSVSEIAQEAREVQRRKIEKHFKRQVKKW